MEEIKVREYVRTKKGTIDIFKEKDKNGLFAGCEKNTYWMPDIVKHSKHIIDVIEVRRLCEWKRSKTYCYV